MQDTLTASQWLISLAGVELGLVIVARALAISKALETHTHDLPPSKEPVVEFFGSTPCASHARKDDKHAQAVGRVLGWGLDHVEDDTLDDAAG